MLGRDVVRAARLSGHEVVAADRAALDVTDSAATEALIADEAPQAVVNCAAFTDVDGAEREPDVAMKVNADAARTVAAAAAAVGATVVYPSSDYVFDGSSETPYLEDDEPNPLGSYGISKLAGEVDTAAVNPQHFIVRSSWLFGVGGRNFVETMLGLARDNDFVVVVRDQVGSPTYTAHLAEGLVRMLDTRAYGLHHMSAAGECSWYDFAVAIFDRAGVDCRVMSTTTDELARPAPRPAYSVMDTRYEDAIHLPAWQDGLIDYLEERK
jgi:dTDP-4-dehydrorhamnose reductase